MDDGALEAVDVDEGLDAVVLRGRPCGSGGCWWEGGVGCGGWGVLAWVSVWVRAVSLGFVSLRLWSCGLRGVVLVVMLLSPAWVCGRVLVWGPVRGSGGPRSGDVWAPVPGREFSRCAAGVPWSPVWSSGGPR